MSPGEVEAKLAGVFAPICTPFAANEDVDHGAMRSNLARYAESAAAFEQAYGLATNAAERERCLFKAGDACFANAQYQVSKNFKIVPEIGFLNDMYNTLGNKEPRTLLAGAKWEMSF